MHHCNTCNRNYNSEEKFDEHNKLYHDLRVLKMSKVIKCDECGFEAKNSQGLGIHKNRQHLKTDTWKNQQPRTQAIEDPDNLREKIRQLKSTLTVLETRNETLTKENKDLREGILPDWWLTEIRSQFASSLEQLVDAIVDSAAAGTAVTTKARKYDDLIKTAPSLEGILELIRQKEAEQDE